MEHTVHQMDAGQAAYKDETDMLTASASIAQLYIAYFNRAPEPVGFDFWLGVLDNTVSLSEIATLFSTQPEAKAIYPFLEDQTSESPENFLTTVYKNLFDREPDQAGLDFWSGVIAAGAELGDILLEIIKGASEADQLVLDAKTDVAEHWVAQAREATDYALNDEVIEVSREALEAANTDEEAAPDGIALTNLYFQSAPHVLLTPTDMPLSSNATLLGSQKVADIVINDDGLGSNTLGLSGADADSFEIQDDALFLKQGDALDFGANGQLDVVVTVDDTGRGHNLTDGPEAGAGLTLTYEVPEFGGAPYTAGDEFQVNEFPQSFQLAPSVATLADGNFVFTWESADQQQGDTSSYSIKGRIFSPDGDAESDEFRVNEFTQNVQSESSVTALADGNFVVTWESKDGDQDDSDGFAIKGRIFSPDGDDESDEFQINEFTQGDQNMPSAATLMDGNFVVTWDSRDGQQGDNDSFAIKGRIFSPDGDDESDEFQVNEFTQGGQLSSSVAVLLDGNFVVTWSSPDPQQGDNDGFAIKARIFSPDGDDESDELQVNEFTQGAQFGSVVTPLADGNFVVTWESEDQQQDDNASRAIKGRIFSPDGEPESDEFQVNEFPQGTQNLASVTTLVDGNFVVAWVSDDQQQGDNDGFAIKARIFSPDGEPEGDEFQVNEFTELAQRLPAITPLEDGGFVVAWQSNDGQQGDNDSFAIKGRIFSAADETLTAVLNPDEDFSYDLAALVGVTPDMGGDEIA